MQFDQMARRRWFEKVFLEVESVKPDRNFFADRSFNTFHIFLFVKKYTFYKKRKKGLRWLHKVYPSVYPMLKRKSRNQGLDIWAIRNILTNLMFLSIYFLLESSIGWGFPELIPEL